MGCEMTDKTIVFEINLPNDESCYECSYLELMQKRLDSSKSDPSTDQSTLNDGLADTNLVDLAKLLEKRYGTMVTMKNSGKQKRVRIDDYLDPGDGYDTQDSFIDDSEAVDVFVAPNISTRFGGFFVHQGAVEGLEDQSIKIEAPWNARVMTSSSTQAVIRKKSKSKELLDKAVKRLSTPHAYKQKSLTTEQSNPMRNLDSVFDEVLATTLRTSDSSKYTDRHPSTPVNIKVHSSPVSEIKNASERVFEPVNIPTNLPPDIVTCLQNLAELNCQNGVWQRHNMGKAFDAELLRLDSKLKETKSNQSIKSNVFGYLESNLHLKHKTLMRRLKRLREAKQVQRMNPLLDAFADAIVSSMPPIMESYMHDKEVHIERMKLWQAESVASELDGTESQTPGTTPSDASTPKRLSKPGPPKKLFRWNVECRQLFEQIVICRLETYYVLNVKGPIEEYLKQLFPTLIQLWPDGWISNAALWRTAVPIFQKFCDKRSCTNGTNTGSQCYQKPSTVPNNSTLHKDTSANHSMPITTNSLHVKVSTSQSVNNGSSESPVNPQLSSPLVVIPTLSPTLISKPLTLGKSNTRNGHSAINTNGPINFTGQPLSSLAISSKTENNIHENQLLSTTGQLPVNATRSNIRTTPPCLQTTINNKTLVTKCSVTATSNNTNPVVTYTLHSKKESSSNSVIVPCTSAPNRSVVASSLPSTTERSGSNSFQYKLCSDSSCTSLVTSTPALSCKTTKPFTETTRSLTSVDCTNYRSRQSQLSSTLVDSVKPAVVKSSSLTNKDPHNVSCALPFAKTNDKGLYHSAAFALSSLQIDQLQQRALASTDRHSLPSGSRATVLFSHLDHNNQCASNYPASRRDTKQPNDDTGNHT